MRAPALLLLSGAMLVGAGLRVWLALHDDGIYWPDEIYQSLEPAHRLVYHYGLVAWEFQEGARSWAFPGLIAGLLALARALGGTSPGVYIPAVKLFMAALSLAAAPAIYGLARRLGSSPLAAAASGGAWALASPVLYFAPRALSEGISATTVVAGFALAAGKEASRTQRLLGAGLLGLAVLWRLQNALFCGGLLLVYGLMRAWRPLAEALGVFTFWALAFGGLDALTWGVPFHSAAVYLKFNVLEGRSALWGTADAAYFVRTLFHSMPWLTPLLGLTALLAVRRAPGVWLTAVGYFVVHSLIPHKELRFMLPDLPLLFALAAVGMGELAARLPVPALEAGVLFASLGSALGFHQLRFGDLGAYEDSRPLLSAYDDQGPVNRLLLRAHGLADLCGLKIEATHLAWSGGYTYLHRQVPLYHVAGPDRRSGHFNYVLTVPQLAVGGQVVAEEGPLVLLKLGDGPCVPDPSFNARLP